MAKSKKTKRPKGTLRANRNRYKVDTYVVDGLNNNRYIVSSFAPTLKDARLEAIKVARDERNQYDHSLVSIDSAIYKRPKRYKMNKR